MSKAAVYVHRGSPAATATAWLAHDVLVTTALLSLSRIVSVYCLFLLSAFHVVCPSCAVKKVCLEAVGEVCLFRSGGNLLWVCIE